MTLSPDARTPSADLHTLTGSSAPGRSRAASPFLGPNPALRTLVEQFEAWATEAVALEEAHKGVDHEDIPGHDALSDRMLEIAAAMYNMRADNMADVILVSRFLRHPWIRDDKTTAADLGRNLADDILRLNRGAPVQPFMVSTVPAGEVLEMPDTWRHLRVGVDAAMATFGAARAARLNPDAEVIDLAGRVKALARRDHRIWDRRAAIQDAIATAFPLSSLPPRPKRPNRMTLDRAVVDGLRITTLTEPVAPDAAYEAAAAQRQRLEAEMEARLGAPRWKKLSGRTFRRLVRWAERLAPMQPRTQEGLKAKAEVQGVLAETGNAGDWTEKYAEAVGRDALRLATALVATPATVDPMLDLHREAEAIRAATLHVGDRNEVEDALFARWNALEEQAIATPPTTLEGAIARLEWGLKEHRDFNMVGTPDNGDRVIDAALAGALGVLRTQVGPSTRAATPHPDAVLLALAPAWAASAARCDATAVALDEASHQLQARIIPAPEALFSTEQDHRRAKPYGSEHIATGRRWFGEASSIEALRQGYPKELSEERRREIIGAYEGWRGERLAAEEATGYIAAREDDQDAGAENRALRRTILATQAHTLDGILLKARVARWCFMDDEDEIAQHLAFEAKHNASAGETAAFSILLDLARMLPGGHGHQSSTHATTARGLLGPAPDEDQVRPAASAA